MSAVPIPAGAVFTISTGCYSDYSVSGVFRAVRDIDTETLKEEWLKKYPAQRERYHFDDCAFLADVFRRGLFEPVSRWEWHLTDYSDADEMRLSGPGVWSP
jgi:hypothetical protein